MIDAQSDNLWLIYIAGDGLGTDSDSDSKPNGYIILYTTCSHYSDSDLYSLFLYRTGIRIQICTRVRLWQCK